MGILKQLALNGDVWLGQWLDLQHLAHTREAFVPGGRGVYAREEWTQARRAGDNDAGPESAAIDTEAGFLRRVFGGERRKLESGLRLADHLEQAGGTGPGARSGGDR